MILQSVEKSAILFSWLSVGKYETRKWKSIWMADLGEKGEINLG
jgi:hypothetical protein